MVASKQLENEKLDEVRDVLLLRHRHQNERKHAENGGIPIIRSFADIGKRHTDSNPLNNHGKVLELL